MPAKSTTSIAGRAHGAAPPASKPQTGRWYPLTDGSPDVHPEVALGLRTAFDNIYETRDQVQKLTATAPAGSSTGSGAMGGGGASGGGVAAASPANGTGILGIQYNAATDPQSLPHGANTTYNAQTGQFDFSTPAGFVAAPASANSPGVKGQISHDGSNFYVCIGTNQWMKTALSSF